MTRILVTSLIVLWCVQHAECDCNQKYVVMSNDVRYITSPNYPGNFTQPTDCYYEISTSSSEVGTVVYLEVVDVTLACDDSRSRLDVYDGFSRKPRHLGQVCQGGKTTFESPKHVLYLIFRSRTVLSHGFRLRVSAKPKYSHCYTQNTLMLNATDTPDVLVSPFYPYEMDQNLNCRWLLMAPEGSRVKVTLLDSNMKGSLGCYNFGLFVYDGKTSDEDFLVAKVCNTTRLSLMSTGSYLLVVFTSSHMVYQSGSGIRLQYSAVPAPRDDSMLPRDDSMLPRDDSMLPRDDSHSQQLVDQTVFFVIASFLLVITTGFFLTAVMKIFILPRRRRSVEGRRRVCRLRTTDSQTQLLHSLAPLGQLPSLHLYSAGAADTDDQNSEGPQQQHQQQHAHQCQACGSCTRKCGGRHVLVCTTASSGVLLSLASSPDYMTGAPLGPPPSYKETLSQQAVLAAV
ncbi:deleted in malignant brain tumors 1 protein-like isoform X1 [Pomacea canaliculata]|uniref:deleted in malignant brain tumors 1 protein-like isoform X1 n=1 Tax=Pomacea canaliculata TaxID=400727 RepID=UPI000D736CE3|nr:deleted in malignant brain tumors 1 protein-like isoform X1 [Pomacea canaliculata]